MGDITGLYMVDDEGELSTVDVQAKFINGKPDRIEAKYVMRSTLEWDRFMRFMERYAEDKGLGFSKVSEGFYCSAALVLVLSSCCTAHFKYLVHKATIFGLPSAELSLPPHSSEGNELFVP
jgi:Psb28 protein